MNPITCGMAADLLPLYLDGCCSNDSRAAQGLAGCVENVPFSLDGLFLSHSGHVCFLRWKANAFYDKNF